MIFHLLYAIGQRLALILPLSFSYRIASFLADMHYFVYAKERRAVIKNLSIVLNKPSGDSTEELSMTARDVFRNFAKYLVDFFRFSRIDISYIKEHITIEGLSNLEEALKRDKGVIVLSAHLGNWELGGYVLGRLGYAMNAVVLAHENEKVNEFFKRQRSIGNFKSIEIGAGLRGCYRALKNNELVALLGDRNFSNSGLTTEFFGKKMFMPKGVAVLSIRTQAAIVPSYMIREHGSRFRMIIEKPIYAEPGPDDDRAVEQMMRRYLPSIENMIRRYPGQWHVFKDFWEGADGKDQRPDTVI